MSDILIIDDCPEATLLATNALKDHNVYSAKSITEAKETLGNIRFSLFIIDIDLPDGSGLDLCLELTNTPQFEDTPKLIFSGQDDISKKVFGFSCGADDYITKPFSQLEFTARVNSKLRKSKKNHIEFLFDFQFDHSFQKCTYVGSQEVQINLELTPTEFRILYTLFKKANIPVSRRELVKAVWNSNGLNIETRGIDSHISHIRKKLKENGKNLISVYGQGYSYQV